MAEPTIHDLKNLTDFTLKERELIWRLRNEYRFGSVEVLVRDGVPQAILKTVKRRNLGEKLSTFTKSDK